MNMPTATQIAMPISMPYPRLQTIQFIRRGEVVTLSNVPPTRTLLLFNHAVDMPISMPAIA